MNNRDPYSIERTLPDSGGVMCLLPHHPKTSPQTIPSSIHKMCWDKPGPQIPQPPCPAAGQKGIKYYIGVRLKAQGAMILTSVI